MNVQQGIPAPPPVPPIPKIPPAIIYDDDDEYKEKRFQKDLQFRMVGAIEKESTQLLQHLIDCGVNTNATILLVKTPLIHALDCFPVNKTIIQLLLGPKTLTNPNLGDKTPWGIKPLHSIARQGLVDIAEILFVSQCGPICDVNVRDNGGATPLHFAAMYGNIDMVLYLLSKGADVNAVDDCGRSPLHRACESHAFRVAEILIERGISVNCMDKYKWTPIFHSVLFRHFDMVKFLVDHGADVELTDIYGESLIRIACYLQGATESGKHYPVKITIGTSFNFYERSRGIPSESLKRCLNRSDGDFYGMAVFNELKLLINTGTDPNTYPTDGHVQHQRKKTVSDLAKTRAYLVLAGSILDPMDSWVTTDTDWKQWFTIQLKEQYSLRRFCRRKIRQSLKHTRDINAAVEQIPLPNSLKMYLQLAEYEQLLNTVGME